MCIADGISMLSCIEAEIYVTAYVLPVQGHMFDFRHAQMSDSFPTSLSVLPDSENLGIAVVISLLLCIEAEIYVISVLLPVNGLHL